MTPVRLAWDAADPPSDCAGISVDLGVAVVVDPVDVDLGCAATAGLGDLCRKPMSKDATVPDPKTSNQRGTRVIRL